MRRAFLIGLLLAGLALAQAPAGPQFLLRIEPVRSGFTLQNMTPEESKTAGEHFAYLKTLFASGKLTYAGQALDPKGLWGVIVVNAPDAQAAKELLDGDPGVKAKMFRGEVIPFRTVLERAASSAKP
jgi:uncharacterized protein YciI